jgi:hypothetical protein
LGGFAVKKVLGAVGKEGVRMPLLGRRHLLIVAVALLPVGLLTWPWEFLPLRWQCSQVRDAGALIYEVELLRQSLGRLPTNAELDARLPTLREADDYGYAPKGEFYFLSTAYTFDSKVVYDSRTGQWSREP